MITLTHTCSSHQVKVSRAFVKGAWCWRCCWCVSPGFMGILFHSVFSFLFCFYMELFFTSLQLTGSSNCLLFWCFYFIYYCWFVAINLTQINKKINPPSPSLLHQTQTSLLPIQTNTCSCTPKYFNFNFAHNYIWMYQNDLCACKTVYKMCSNITLSGNYSLTATICCINKLPYNII